MLKFLCIGSAIGSLTVRIVYFVQKYLRVASIKKEDINSEDLNDEIFIQLQKYNIERIIGLSIHDMIYYLLRILFISFVLPIVFYEYLEKYIKFEDHFYFKQIFYIFIIYTIDYFTKIILKTIAYEIFKKRYPTFVSPTKSILKYFIYYAVEALSLSIFSYIVIYLIELLQDVAIFKFVVFLIIFAILYPAILPFTILVCGYIVGTTKKLEDEEFKRQIIEEVNNLGFKTEEIYSSTNKNFVNNTFAYFIELFFKKVVVLNEKYVAALKENFALSNLIEPSYKLNDNYGYIKNLLIDLVMPLFLFTGYKYFYSSDMMKYKLENGKLPTVLIVSFYFLLIDVIINLWGFFIHIKQYLVLTCVDDSLIKEGKGEAFYNSLLELSKNNFYKEKIKNWVSKFEDSSVNIFERTLRFKKKLNISMTV